jgi:hypothetical protein
MNKPLSATETGAIHLLSDDERQPCEIWTRVMGYHRPVSSFNKGKNRNSPSGPHSWKPEA